MLATVLKRDDDSDAMEVEDDNAPRARSDKKRAVVVKQPGKGGKKGSSSAACREREREAETETETTGAERRRSAAVSLLDAQAAPSSRASAAARRTPRASARRCS